MGHRFFASPDQITPPTVTLSDEESHHLTRVLRIGPGTKVRVFDGVGREYECEVQVASRSAATLAIVNEVTGPVESQLRLTLGQALIKNDKFDWVVQKATELGVNRIVPLITAHSEVVLSEERGDKRVKRWERIALEALKQCGRRRLVEIAVPAKWEDYCRADSNQVRLLLSEHGGISLKSAARNISSRLESISIATGPEGGWDKDEVDVGLSLGQTAVLLGPRILRAETAAVAGVTMVQYLFGDLSTE
jgi:16S rRNA (uracil1498-N3)-methyltransferase